MDILNFQIGRSYSFIHVVWKGERYQNLNIKIDIVPAFPFTDKISISSIHDQRSEKDSNNYISIKSEFAKAKYTLSLSMWENELILGLPEPIRLGYKLAKAMRNNACLAPIIPLLIKLGVCHDTEDLITSYQIKTCLFFVLGRDKKSRGRMIRLCTCQNAQMDYQPIDDRNFVEWAIAIFRKMRWFITKAENRAIPHFFLEQRVFIENTPFRKTLFSCDRKFGDIELICCRKQKAMVLVIDQILRILSTSVCQRRGAEIFGHV